MLIKKVTLKNFRQYREEQTIEFATDKEKNVTIIYGEMGCGKSNLFSAINWCLYGELDGVGSDSEIVNKAALSEASDRGDVETVVEVDFSHEGKNYHCIRTLKAKGVSLIKDNDGNERFTYLPEQELYLCTIRGTGECERDNDPTRTIHSILPSEMRKYFFFDGEKIDELSKSGHENEVKNGIKAVLQLDIITRAINHLKQVCKEYDRKLEMYSTGDLKGLYGRRSEINDEIDDLEEKQLELQNERSKAEKLKSEYDNRLLELGEIKEQVEQRSRLENRLEDLNDEFENNELKMKDVATKSIIVLSERICNEATKIVDQKRQKGEIPTGIRETFLNDLLENRICICDRHIKENSPEERAIQRRLSDTKPGKIEELVLELPGKLNFLSMEAGRIASDLEGLHSEKTKINYKLEETEGERMNICESLKSIETENISDLELKREETDDRLSKLKIDLSRISEQIKGLKSESNTLKGKIDKATTKEKRETELKKNSCVAEQSRSVLEKINERFIHEMKEEIQAYSQEIFGSLIWKSSQFNKVTISDRFELEVFDKWGTPAKSELSAGERQCFSLAFILAMSKATEAEAPFIMDTPFARISEEPLRNISENLPNLTKQLVLLVTNREFSAEYSADIKPRVGGDYDLRFNDVTGCTTIEERKS